MQEHKKGPKWTQMEQSRPNGQNRNQWEQGGPGRTEVDRVRMNAQIRTKVDI